MDLALALAAAGVPIAAPDDERIAAIRRAIAERRGYIDGPTLTEIGYQVELLFPVRHVFEGRTETLALSWCLVFLMGEAGEVGVGSFRSA
jgi:hypothetical protein